MKKKEILLDLRHGLAVSVILMLLCGLIFPLVLGGISSLIFPKQAKGNLVEYNGVAVGSEYVGQDFTEDYFMKGRPSAVGYNTYRIKEDGTKVKSDGSEFTGVASGSANYGPSNPALVERVEADMEKFLEANPKVAKDAIPTDLMTASGSGLDPHISPASADVQIPAISDASGISEEKLEKIVENNTKGKLFGLIGEETVNVLGVNIEIAKEMGISIE